eukprot:TRINITY_DN26131_c0_g1_i1.p1 TRINITY_DN26131_c0_g1~~TRINITY_DN26131_c0_g1_i1.p1  ORF type:complete len:162 (+),score=45.14 TRINITY_DN26131_c0_g1_i1:68-553(+)
MRALRAAADRTRRAGIGAACLRCARAASSRGWAPRGRGVASTPAAERPQRQLQAAAGADAPAAPQGWRGPAKVSPEVITGIEAAFRERREQLEQERLSPGATSLARRMRYLVANAACVAFVFSWFWFFLGDRLENLFWYFYDAWDYRRYLADLEARRQRLQ